MKRRLACRYRRFVYWYHQHTADAQFAALMLGALWMGVVLWIR